MTNVLPRFRKNRRGVVRYVNHGHLVGVYIIGPSSHGPCKVGVARNPNNRLQCLQAAHWQEIEVLDVRWFDSREDAYAVEESAHAALTRLGLAMRGEWFNTNLDNAVRAVLLSAGALSIPVKADADFGLESYREVKLKNRMSGVHLLSEDEQAFAARNRNQNSGRRNQKK